MPSLKSIIPWWVKIPAKILLSRLPLNYQQWNKIKLFRHGDINDIWSSGKKFLLHFDSAYPKQKPEGFSCLELGTGDSVASGIIASGLGASKTYLVDVGRFATENIDFYKQFAIELRKHKIPAPDLSKVNTFAELLTLCNIEYLTDGVNSLFELPSNSVDFIWSHSVLEHIRKNEFAEMTNELHRLISPDGRMSHNVDLKDHLGGALNNLRFSEQIWESDFMAKSGFYTNRLQHVDIISNFERSGFHVLNGGVGRWKKLPTPVNRMNSMFRKIPKDELRIRSFNVVFESVTK
jgi:SAM-dependent methyltransferase